MRFSAQSFDRPYPADNRKSSVVSITKLLVLPGEIKIYIFVTVKRMQKINMWLKSFYKLEICQSKIDLIHCSVIEFPMQDLSPYVPTSRLVVVVAAKVKVSHIKI